MEGADVENRLIDIGRWRKERERERRETWKHICYYT